MITEPKKIVKAVIAFTIVFSVFVSCKNAQNTSSTEDPSEILLLLDKELTPSSISMLGEFEMTSEKRTSRSQNLWLVKIANLEEVDELIEKLKNQEGVLDVYQSKDGESSNLTNSKKGTSSPKNDK
ncbi:MAG: hypothetical protein AAF391_08525 [Bacteroidota bacterium]